MDGGEIPGISEIMCELKQRRYRLYCLTNWSHETFPIVKKVHARLFDMFDVIVVSGGKEDGETESGDLSAIIKSLSPPGFGEHFH